MKKVIFFLSIVFCSNFVTATNQHPDYLYYKNKKLDLYIGWGHPSPLQTYYSQNNLKYPFVSLSTANYRGHIAIWEIIDDKLYLKKITIENDSFAPQKYNVKAKNDTLNRDSSVFADWFSGVIDCSGDKNSYYFYVKYGEVKNIQILLEEDYKKIREKDTSNQELMAKYAMFVLNQNYIAYYFRLHKKDEIFLNDKKGRFENKKGYSPLLEFYSNDHLKFPYNWENVEKNGAPNCKWIVIDSSVYLEKVQLYSGLGFYEIEIDSVNLDVLFGDSISNNRVFANWLNGVYRIEYGVEKEHTSGYKEFSPTEYVYLRIKNGLIQELYTIPSNFLRNMPTEIDPELKRILNEY